MIREIRDKAMVYGQVTFAVLFAVFFVALIALIVLAATR